MLKSMPLHVLVTESGKIFADMDRDAAYERAADEDGAYVVRELELTVNVPNPIARAQIDLPQEGQYGGGDDQVTMHNRDQNYVRFIVEFEDGTSGFMSISHWHLRDGRGDYMARTFAREHQEDGRLPKKPIASVRRLVADELRDPKI
jgi:hypothetical protein